MSGKITARDAARIMPLTAGLIPGAGTLRLSHKLIVGIFKGTREFPVLA